MVFGSYHRNFHTTVGKSSGKRSNYKLVGVLRMDVMHFPKGIALPDPNAWNVGAKQSISLTF